MTLFCRVAEIARQVNERVENIIGARRLHTVMEKLLEDISYDASDLAAQHGENAFVLHAQHVDERLKALALHEDLSRWYFVKESCKKVVMKAGKCNGLA